MALLEPVRVAVLILGLLIASSNVHGAAKGAVRSQSTGDQSQPSGQGTSSSTEASASPGSGPQEGPRVQTGPRAQAQAGAGGQPQTQPQDQARGQPQAQPQGLPGSLPGTAAPQGQPSVPLQPPSQPGSRPQPQQPYQFPGRRRRAGCFELELLGLSRVHPVHLGAFPSGRKLQRSGVDGSRVWSWLGRNEGRGLWGGTLGSDFWLSPLRAYYWGPWRVLRTGAWVTRNGQRLWIPLPLYGFGRTVDLSNSVNIDDRLTSGIETGFSRRFRNGRWGEGSFGGEPWSQSGGFGQGGSLGAGGRLNQGSPFGQGGLWGPNVGSEQGGGLGEWGSWDQGSGWGQGGPWGQIGGSGQTGGLRQRSRRRQGGWNQRGLWGQNGVSGLQGGFGQSSRWSQGGRGGQEGSGLGLGQGGLFGLESGWGQGVLGSQNRGSRQDGGFGQGSRSGQGGSIWSSTWGQGGSGLNIGQGDWLGTGGGWGLGGSWGLNGGSGQDGGFSQSSRYSQGSGRLGLGGASVGLGLGSGAGQGGGWNLGGSLGQNEGSGPVGALGLVSRRSLGGLGAAGQGIGGVFGAGLGGTGTSIFSQGRRQRGGSWGSESVLGNQGRGLFDRLSRRSRRRNPVSLWGRRGSSRNLLYGGLLGGGDESGFGSGSWSGQAGRRPGVLGGSWRSGSYWGGGTRSRAPSRSIWTLSQSFPQSGAGSPYGGWYIRTYGPQGRSIWTRLNIGSPWQFEYGRGQSPFGVSSQWVQNRV